MAGHRARSLAGQTTTKDGIPVTTAGRTILDFAANLDRRGIERLLDRAENARLGDDIPLGALAQAHHGHRGASKLLATLADRRRDAIHAAAGWRTLRFTHRQIKDEPATVARALTTALDR
jgi:hypothetical protein